MKDAQNNFAEGFKSSFGKAPDDPTDMDNFGFNLVIVGIIAVLCVILSFL